MRVPRRSPYGWWIVAVPAIVASQIVIVWSWRDLWFATIANVLLLMVVLVAFGRWRFARASARAVRGLLARVVDAPNEPLTIAQLAGLPPIVQVWISRSGAIGRRPPRVVHLRQRGAMRLAREGRWMPFHAEQWFTPTAPGFLWVVDVKAAPAIHLVGRDALVDRHGSMRIELLALAPVVDAQGPQIDQSALVRYLAELLWFPAHAPGLRWEAIDATSARATLVDGDRTASGVFTFTSDGDAVSFEGRRYFETTLEDWRVEVESGGHGELGGLRIPLRASLTWKLAAGPWTWFRVEVVSLDEDATLPASFPSLAPRP